MNREKLKQYVRSSNTRKTPDTQRDSTYRDDIFKRYMYLQAEENPQTDLWYRQGPSKILEAYLQRKGNNTDPALLERLMNMSDSESRFILTWLVCFAMESGQDAAALFRGDMGPDDGSETEFSAEWEKLSLLNVVDNPDTVAGLIKSWKSWSQLVPAIVFELEDEGGRTADSLMKLASEKSNLALDYFPTIADVFLDRVKKLSPYYFRMKRRAQGLFGQMDDKIQDGYTKWDLVIKGSAETEEDWMYIINEREGRFKEWKDRKLANTPGLIDPATIDESIVARSWMNFLPDGENAYKSFATKVYSQWGDRNPSYSIKHEPSGLYVPTPLTHIGKVIKLDPSARDQFAENFHRMLVEPYLEWLNKTKNLDPAGWSFDHHGSEVASKLQAIRLSLTGGDLRTKVGRVVLSMEGLLGSDPNSIPYSWRLYLRHL